MSLRASQIILVGSVLVVSGASAQPEHPSAWKRSLERFESGLDELLDELTWTESQHRAQIGIFVPGGSTPEAAALLPDRWTPLGEGGAPPSRLVLLVHGLDEPGDIWSDLAPELVRAGLAVARFEYPNDQRVKESAGQLLEHLRAARGAGVEEVSIIGHSMGGLVSFDALTREDGYAGDPQGGGTLPRVRRVIAVGTPWEGSPFARLRALAEIREQVQRWLMDKTWDARPILDYRRDGMGEAGADLEPGSALLTELSGRAWPEGLALTVLAGRITGADEMELSWLAESKILRELLGQEDLDALCRDLSEAASTLGDGAVPLDSALARGAADTTVFEVNHRALIRRSPIDFVTGSGPDGPPGIGVILDRLKQDRLEQDRLGDVDSSEGG